MLLSGGRDKGRISQQVSGYWASSSTTWNDMYTYSDRLSHYTIYLVERQSSPVQFTSVPWCVVLFSDQFFFCQPETKGYEGKKFKEETTASPGAPKPWRGGAGGRRRSWELTALTGPSTGFQRYCGNCEWMSVSVCVYDSISYTSSNAYLGCRVYVSSVWVCMFTC